MMAIADSFEALTAADRPCKLGKTVSQALANMAKMRKDPYIDPELLSCSRVLASISSMAAASCGPSRPTTS